jgi:ABC-2 type transport system permease protein
MRSALRLCWLEIKLFVRDPMTVLFSLALPVLVLFVLGGVFGNTASKPGEMVVYRGVGPMSYYVPAYLALVAASVGVISLPAHIAGNRERGVLKRYHASGVSVWAVASSQVAVAVALSTVSAAILLVIASLGYDFSSPESILGTIGAFLLVVLGFAAFGILLGSVLKTARSAQAVGVLAWFVMMMLGGAGPPREVLTDQMRFVSDLTPLWPAVKMIQGPWLGLDPGSAWLVFGGIVVACAGLGVYFFRWE